MSVPTWGIGGALQSPVARECTCGKWTVAKTYACRDCEAWRNFWRRVAKRQEKQRCS